jgi:hypothetical protein
MTARFVSEANPFRLSYSISIRPTAAPR